MPPTRLATTGRVFHIASATVRPNPSAKLFWTTTVDERCSAFTMNAFSMGSSIGRLTRWTRLRCSDGRCLHAWMFSASTSVASGSSSTEAAAGPASTRCASRTGSTYRTNASRTPMWSFSRSQREICITIGWSGGAGASSTDSARWRTGTTGPASISWSSDPITPAAWSVTSAAAGEISTFFGAVGSMHGGMMSTGRVSPSHTYAEREKTSARACSTSARRKFHADRTRSFAVSTPT
jgi:hypothetical protein